MIGYFFEVNKNKIEYEGLPMFGLKNFKWYRKLRGGNWYFYKLGRDTPSIRLFSVWLKDEPPYRFDDTMILLDKEKYIGQWWKRGTKK